MEFANNKVVRDFLERSGQEALNELVEIDTVANIHSNRYAVVPMMRDEPIGVQRLLALAAG